MGMGPNIREPGKMYHFIFRVTRCGDSVFK